MTGPVMDADTPDADAEVGRVFAVTDTDEANWFATHGEAAVIVGIDPGEWTSDVAELLAGHAVTLVIPETLDATVDAGALVRAFALFAAPCVASLHVCAGFFSTPDECELIARPVADWLKARPDAEPEADDHPDTDEAGGGVTLPIIDPTLWEGLPIPPRSWHVEGLIPARTVTKLSGAGGEGKSLLALQLLAATATGLRWLGREVTPGRALYLSAEDEADEVHRRLADIVREHDVTFGDLADLRIAPLAGLDAVLAAPAGRNGQIAATPLWRALEALVADFRPSIVAIDTLADAFGGDEINRVQARQFIALLRGLALRHDCAVLILSHPSLTGIASGKGSSGSTGWDNSVRSALYLTRDEPRDGEAPDPDLRVLKAVKANYAPTDAKIALRWQRGVFVAEAGDGEAAPSWLDRKAAASDADATFLRLLAKFMTQGRDASALTGRNYAPFLFAKEPAANGIRKPAFEAAMRRLLDADKIEVRKAGPASRQRSFLAIKGNPGVGENA